MLAARVVLLDPLVGGLGVFHVLAGELYDAAVGFAYLAPIDIKLQAAGGSLALGRAHGAGAIWQQSAGNIHRHYQVIVGSGVEIARIVVLRPGGGGVSLALLIAVLVGVGECDALLYLSSSSRAYGVDYGLSCGAMPPIGLSECRVVVILIRAHLDLVEAGVGRGMAAGYRSTQSLAILVHLLEVVLDGPVVVEASAGRILHPDRIGLHVHRGQRFAVVVLAPILLDERLVQCEVLPFFGHSVAGA